MEDLRYVSPEFREKLGNLSETLRADRFLLPRTEEQLTLEWDIQQAIERGDMTIQEGAQCLEDYEGFAG